MGGSDTSAIAVTPSALAAVALQVHGVGERVHASVAEVVAPVGASIGDLGCGQALTEAERAVGQTLASSAAGILALSRALTEAADAYVLADEGAVPGQPPS